MLPGNWRSCAKHLRGPFSASSRAEQCELCRPAGWQSQPGQSCDSVSHGTMQGYDHRLPVKTRETSIKSHKGKDVTAGTFASGTGIKQAHRPGWQTDSLTCRVQEGSHTLATGTALHADFIFSLFLCSDKSASSLSPAGAQAQPSPCRVQDTLHSQTTPPAEVRQD